MVVQARELEKHKLYGVAYRRVLDEAVAQMEDGEKRNIEKIIWYGVRYLTTMPDYKDYEFDINSFNLISGIKGLMSSMTLQQFKNVFPIKKDFNGARWGVKDYFYTMEYIKRIGLEPNDLLGDFALELLANYWNDDIGNLYAKSLAIMSSIRRHEGHLSLFEEFMAQQGQDTPNTFKNSKGQAYYVRQGKPVKVQMRKPNHLKTIK